jgi:hypothetical protein
MFYTTVSTLCLVSRWYIEPIALSWPVHAGICRYSVPYLLFVPEFHMGTYQYILFLFTFSVFLTAYPCYAFKKYTDTSELPFPVLIIPDRYDVGGRDWEKLQTDIDIWFRLFALLGANRIIRKPIRVDGPRWVSFNTFSCWSHPSLTSHHFPFADPDTLLSCGGYYPQRKTFPAFYTISNT